MVPRSLFRRVVRRAATRPALSFAPISRLLRYPAEVALELTNRCNLCCVMCFRSKMKRPLGQMEQSLARKAVDEVKAFPKSIFLPQGFGESLLHPHFTDILGYARSVLPNTIAIITNGTLLKRDLSSIIVKEQLADAIIISVESADKESYEKIRVKGSFEALEENIAGLFELRQSLGKSKPQVILRGVVPDDGHPTHEVLRQKWGSQLQEGDEIAVNRYQDWVGAVDDSPSFSRPDAMRRDRKRAGCRRLYDTLTIGLNGDVTPCCYDYELSLCVGNIKDVSLRDIWLGEKLERIRKLLIHGRCAEVPLCSKCSYWE